MRSPIVVVVVVAAILGFICCTQRAHADAVAAAAAIGEYDEAIARELSHFAAVAYAPNATACMPRLQFAAGAEWRIVDSVTLDCSWVSDGRCCVGRGVSEGYEEAERRFLVARQHVSFCIFSIGKSQARSFRFSRHNDAMCDKNRPTCKRSNRILFFVFSAVHPSKRLAAVTRL